MHPFGGFESNAQTLRLATNIEEAYNPYGLDLTRRTLLGILKYPIKRSSLLLDLEKNLIKEADWSLWTPYKVYYDDDQNIVEWILAEFSASDVDKFQHTVDNRSLYHSFDCSIMDIADSIAYGVHDLEDAIHLRLIQRHHFDNNEFINLIADTHLDAHEVINGLFAQDLAQKKRTIGALVHFFISAVKVCELSEFSHPLIRFQAKLTESAQRFLNFLINQVFKQIIDSPPARAQEFGGQNLLINLFNSMLANPERLLDSASRGALHNISTHKQLTRIVCDAIANLTDDSAIRLHKKLYAENFTAQWDTSFYD